MESRLPQPKVVVPKVISTMDLTTKPNTRKIKPEKSDSTESNSNGTSERMQKAKSTMNLAAKAGIENKPPPKPTLMRSKTTISISRTASATNKATKRPGTAVTHGELKKVITTSTVRSAALTQRPGGTTLAVSNTANRTAPSVATSKKTVARVPEKAPPKWDLKGRLAHSNNQLISMKERHKDIESKNVELQEMVTTLQASEASYKHEIEKYEVTNKCLDEQVHQLKTEMSTIQGEKDELHKRLQESTESFNAASKELEVFKEKCSSQQILLDEHTVVVEHLKTNVQNLETKVESQKKTIEELTSLKDELQSLVHRLDMDRRVLHNTIQEMKGNIRVFCRVRPRTPSESMKTLCAINYIDECTIEVGKSDGSDSMSCSGKMRAIRQEFSFDKVFPPNASQEDIFKELSLLVQSALEGYNVCVFAYGQTGSGKTYTMEGLPGLEMEGMIPRTVRHIFREMKQFQLLGWEYKIEASFLEIYNEHIVDLLDPQPKSYEIRMADAKGHDLYVSNLTIQEIHSPEELQECLSRAQRNRAVAATQSNERSSRSHSVARIRLIGTHLTKAEISIGNLNLVDLAGSERLKGEETARLAETKNINKSLANLGNVILALLKKQEHVPYRNSKLTHLLMPSLGGNSKTLMLLNVSPLDECYNETLNSLRFASNVNSCKTGNIKRTRTVLSTAT